MIGGCVEIGTVSLLCLRSARGRINGPRRGESTLRCKVTDCIPAAYLLNKPPEISKNLSKKVFRRAITCAFFISR